MKRVYDSSLFSVWTFDINVPVVLVLYEVYVSEATQLLNRS